MELWGPPSSSMLLVSSTVLFMIVWGGGYLHIYQIKMWCMKEKNEMHG